MYPQTGNYWWMVVLMFLLANNVFGQHASHGESDISQRISEYFLDLENNNKFMGSVMVVKDGQTVHCKAYGFCRIEEGRKKIPADEQTAYRIGSISKMFTAVLISQLVDAKKFSLDDKLSKFFPDVNNADQISIDQLLRHRSGLKNLTATPSYTLWCKTPQSREAMLERIENLSADFLPGEKTEYSNTNYLLLGYIVEKVTGSKYGNVLEKKITKPLGMQRTFFEPDEPIKNEAASFRLLKNWIAVWKTDQSVPHGAGAIVSTPEDLTIFIRALFAGQLVSRQSLERITDTSSGMGQGMRKFPFDNRRALGHGGSIDGFRSNLVYFPDDNVIVAICGNGIAHPFNDVMIGLLTRTFGMPVTSAVETNKVDVATLRNYEGIYASKGFSLKITIAVDGKGNLTGQATGQNTFPFSATSETSFRFDPAGIKIEFFESKKDKGFDSFRFEQRKNKRTFKKMGN